MYSTDVSRPDLLELLIVIAERYRDDHEIISLVLKVLANISCDPSYAEHIRSSGKHVIFKRITV